jgi:hypothetical protein
LRRVGAQNYETIGSGFFLFVFGIYIIAI